jgi:hypothetical protein
MLFFNKKKKKKQVTVWAESGVSSNERGENENDALFSRNKTFLLDALR